MCRLPFSVKKRIADVYLLDGAEEQVMRAERNALLDPTAEECGSFIQRGCVKIRNLADMQPHFGEFIDIPTALYAAEIRRTAERLTDEIQAEYAGLHDLRIRVARRTEGYADHRRIAVDDARPATVIRLFRSKPGSVPRQESMTAGTGERKVVAPMARKAFGMVFPPWKWLEKSAEAKAAHSRLLFFHDTWEIRQNQ